MIMSRSMVKGKIALISGLQPPALIQYKFMSAQLRIELTLAIRGQLPHGEVRED